MTDDQILAEAIRTLGVAGAVVAVGLGLNVGSFLNVVAHRVPLGLSVVRPRSRCPACRTPVRAIDNIPVLSWLLLRGRCRGCKGRISGRYAVVELLMGALALHIFWATVFRTDEALVGAAWAHFGVVFAAVAAMLAASLIDVDHRILPDTITKSGMWAAPVLVALAPRVIPGGGMLGIDWMPSSLPAPVVAALLSIAGIAVGGGVIWSLGKVGSQVFGKPAMGFGDVKFLGMIGGFVGPGGALLTLVLAAFFGAVGGGLRFAFTRDRYIPFGPFLAVGAYVTLLHGPELVDWYVGLVSVAAY